MKTQTQANSTTTQENLQTPQTPPNQQQSSIIDKTLTTSTGFRIHIDDEVKQKIAEIENRSKERYNQIAQDNEPLPKQKGKDKDRASEKIADDNQSETTTDNDAQSGENISDEVLNQKNYLESLAGEEYKFPEEIASKTAKTKNAFLVALGKESKKIEERLTAQIEQKLREELEKKYAQEYSKSVSELEQKLQEREKLIAESQNLLSLIAVEKSPEFIALTQQIDSIEKEVFGYAESLGIEKSKVKILLSGNPKERAKAKVEVRKEYDVDGEAFLEFIEEYVPKYREAFTQREDMVTNARANTEKFSKENAERQRWERIKKEQETRKQIEQYSQLTAEFVAKNVLNATDKDTVDSIKKSTIETVNRIISQENESMRSIETLAIISENEALTRKFAQMQKQLAEMKKKLESAGIGESVNPDNVSKTSGVVNTSPQKMTFDEAFSITQKFANQNPLTLLANAGAKNS